MTFTDTHEHSKHKTGEMIRFYTAISIDKLAYIDFHRGRRLLCRGLGFVAVKYLYGGYKIRTALQKGRVVQICAVTDITALRNQEGLSNCVSTDWSDQDAPLASWYCLMTLWSVRDVEWDIVRRTTLYVLVQRIYARACRRLSSRIHPPRFEGACNHLWILHREKTRSWKNRKPLERLFLDPYLQCKIWRKDKVLTLKNVETFERKSCNQDISNFSWAPHASEPSFQFGWVTKCPQRPYGEPC